MGMPFSKEKAFPCHFPSSFLIFLLGFWPLGGSSVLKTVHGPPLALPRGDAGCCQPAAGLDLGLILP